MAKAIKSEWIIGAATVAGLGLVFIGGNALRHKSVTTTTEPPPIEEPKDFLAEMQKHEHEVLSQPDSRVTRDGDNLHVKIKDSSAIDFKDCVECGPDKDVEHFLVEDSAHGVLIYRQFYEGEDFAFVAADGLMHELPGWPVFSPAGRTFIIVGESELIGWSGLELWNVQAPTPVREFQMEPKPEEPLRFVGWEGEDVIHLEQTTETEKGPSCLSLNLVHEKSGWVSHPQPNPKPGACSEAVDWVPKFLQTSST